MKLLRFVPATVAAALFTTAGLAAYGAATTTDSAAASAATTSAEVVTAANAFLATLSASEQDTVTYDYDATSAKYKWSNLPTTLTARNGLKLGDLTTAQRTAAMNLVDALLSDQGYTQATAIMAADDNLASVQSSDYGSDKYYIALFGTPSSSSPFFVQFGGHHLAINADIDGDNVAVTPEFVGVEPQSFTVNGTTVTPMSGEKAAVFNLLGSLTSAQLNSAKISGTFDDVVMGAGAESKSYPATAGILVSSLSADQQALVTTAIEQWVDDFPDDVAADYMDAYTSAYDETYIGWGNTTSSDGRAYFRISGPRVWIEYIHQNGIVYPSQLHLHTVFRDKASDYDASATTTTTSTTSTSTLTAAQSRRTYGTAAKVTVTVAVDGTTVPTGTVTIYDTSGKLAAGTLSKGTATITLPKTLSAGKHTLTAVFTGDSSVADSTSNVVTLKVAKHSSSITATLRRGVVEAGTKPVVQYKVKPSSPAAVGKVKIIVDGRVVRTEALKAEKAGKTQSLAIPALTRGTHTVRVVFKSDNFKTSKSARLTLRVTS